MGKPAKPVEIGERYGRLVVTLAPIREGRYLYAEVLCDCGQVKVVIQNSLLKGLSKSCGCLNKEMIAARSVTHGMRGHRVYPVWNMVVQRCTNPNHPQWKDYGGRGITVTKRWLKFENFLADMGEPPDAKLSIERKNNNLGYYKANCKWATRKEQARNKRNNRMFEYMGKERCVAEIAEMTSMPYMRLYQRLVTYGWIVAQAVQP
jgi:hypothetical protein